MVLLEATDKVVQDAALLAQGAYAPLAGFVDARQHASILDAYRLPDGKPFAIPITLPIPPELAQEASREGEIVLVRGGQRVARVQVESVFLRDVGQEALKTYGTSDPKHPGVASILAEPSVAASGPVEWLLPAPGAPDAPAALTPAQTREAFRERGFRTVAAFQTRNAPHRGHEHLLRLALEYTDGLLIHPLVGVRKAGDLSAESLLSAYEHLAKSYFRADRFVLTPFVSPMRYAGPREAIHHAIVRRNFGATHFIVGRDHAGVGSYYGPYDAHAAFDRYAPGEVGIEILRFHAAFHCDACDTLVTEKVCPHPPEARRTVSGTQVRATIRAGGDLDSRILRPDVVAAIRQAGGGAP